MIADLKPYAEYKESGLPWLGQVPGHWSVSRIKTVLRETDRRSEDGAGTLLSLTRVRGLIPHRDMTDKMHSAKTLAGYKRYRAGQLVMNRMQAWSGMFGAGEIDGLVSPDYAVFDVLGGHAIKLVLARLKTPDLVGQFALESKGIGSGFNRLYTDRFGPIPISLPPPDEQAAIVRFLDWAGGRLERAIRAKRKVIALLNEQKQAIIHRAVTRGLDPAVPLKPSGIPWLGDIPQHWEVSRIKNEFRCLNTQRVPLNSVERGAMTARTYDYYGASGVIDKVDDYIFDDELLLIAEDGANLVLRNLPLAIIARGKFWVNNHAHILKPRRGSILYLAHVLETLNYKPWISGAAQPKLTQDRLMSISIAVAPPEEQVTIVNQTSEQTRPLVTAISRLEREIELLREYRTRLVADVVTGKLDVRAATAGLPDEAPPDTAEDDADLGFDSEAADEEAAA